MKNLILLATAVFTFGAFAQVQLVSGDYGVSVRDRHGNTHHCTLEIQNIQAEEMLTLSINDCPPPVNNVELYYGAADGSYMSAKIYVNTRRGGFKMYEIIPGSSTQFEMVSYREYGDGGVGRPRRVTATLK